MERLGKGVERTEVCSDTDESCLVQGRRGPYFVPGATRGSAHFIYGNTLRDKLFDPFLDEEMMTFLGLAPCQGQVELAGLSDPELSQACISEMPERPSQTSSNLG